MPYAKPGPPRTTTPESDGITDEEWFALEQERNKGKFANKSPRLIDRLQSQWWFVNLVYNKLKAYRIMRYLFGWGGVFSRNRRLEREYDRGGDKVEE